MKLSLSANISRLRKERSMTQEQLAEALGVTFAAVSKWERGVATPELKLIAEMADLFDVSLDAIVGFEMKNSGAAALEERIRTLQHQKKYEEGILEAEKALLRYPNNFRIVYRSGELYIVAGVEQTCKKWMYRSIELLERAILLLSQNNDPEISEVSLQNEIAQCYIVLGETKKGIELLKKYNLSGVHNALIAIALTGNAIAHTKTPEYDLESAVPFMANALSSIIMNTMRTMIAYANYFGKKENYASAAEALLWMIGFFESLKIDPNAVSYLDKVIAPCYSECANLSLLLGKEEDAEPYLRRAYETAVRYDAMPTSSVKNLKFFFGDSENKVVYDDLGDSAMAAVLEQLTHEDREHETLYQLWQQIVAEKTCGGAK